MSRISNTPIMLFASVMGFGGFGIGYRMFNEIYGFSQIFFEIYRVLVLGLFVVILGFYIAKIFSNFSHAKAEFSHPIKINFFAAIPISLLILAILFSDVDIIWGILFYVGVTLQSVLTLYVVKIWIEQKFESKFLNPAWFIPIVGNLIVPIAAHGEDAYLWYYFGIGMFFYVVLFAVIFYKLIFLEPLMEKFTPTLFILIAPPAIAFLDYMKLIGHGKYDGMANILFSLSVFFALLMIFMYQRFIKLKFFMSWWAYTFPLAAFGIACFKVFELSYNVWILGVGVGVNIALAIILCVTSTLTIKGIMDKSIYEAE